MAVDFNRSMIDPLQDRQFRAVFSKFDEHDMGSLEYDTFKEFLYAIGMNFLCTQYLKEIESALFDGNLGQNRCSYDEFKSWVDERCRFEDGPDMYEPDMAIFDEDRNGLAPIEDVMRVMKDHAGMSDQEISDFIKVCAIGQDKMTKEDREKPLD